MSSLRESAGAGRRWRGGHWKHARGRGLRPARLSTVSHHDRPDHAGMNQAEIREDPSLAEAVRHGLPGENRVVGSPASPDARDRVARRIVVRPRDRLSGLHPRDRLNEAELHEVHVRAGHIEGLRVVASPAGASGNGREENEQEPCRQRQKQSKPQSVHRCLPRMDARPPEVLGLPPVHRRALRGSIYSVQRTEAAIRRTWSFIRLDSIRTVRSPCSHRSTFPASRMVSGTTAPSLSTREIWWGAPPIQNPDPPFTLIASRVVASNAVFLMNSSLMVARNSVRSRPTPVVSAFGSPGRARHSNVTRSAKSLACRYTASGGPRSGTYGITTWNETRACAWARLTSSPRFRPVPSGRGEADGVGVSSIRTPRRPSQSATARRAVGEKASVPDNRAMSTTTANATDCHAGWSTGRSARRRRTRSDSGDHRDGVGACRSRLPTAPERSGSTG